MGGSSRPTTTTQIQKTELPAWVDAASQSNYAFAEQVANRPFEQYQGPRVAGLSGGEQAAPGILAAGMAGSARAYGTAANALAGYAGGVGVPQVQAPTSFLGVNAPQAAGAVNTFNPAANVNMPSAVSNVSAQSFLDRNIQDYINPNLQNVVNTTLQGLDRNINIATQKNTDANRASGSWGGSRDAISNAVLQSEGIRNKAATEAGLRSAAYTDAAGRIQTDNATALQAALANQQKDITGNAQGIAVQQGNQASQNTNNALNAGILQGNQSSFLQTQAQALQAQQANQNAGLTLSGLGVDAQKANATNALQGANLGVTAATNLGALGTDITNTAGKNALLSSQLGANERGVAQAQLDADAAKWQEAYDAPLTALNTRLAALGLSPYGKTTTTNETKSGGTSSNGALTALGGITSFLPLIFSDREVKKDVKRIGKIPGSDLNAYEFKYKKGFMGRDMPSQVGLMAQDVEKKVPGAVKNVEVGGKTVKAVDYGAALAVGRKGRSDKGSKRVAYKPRGFMGRAA